MMCAVYTLGIDIGSAASKCVILKDGKEIVSSSLVVSSIGTGGVEKSVEQVLKSAALRPEMLAKTVATGYGRDLYKDADLTISELTCHTIGGSFFFPGLRTLIDIGGQDSKVVSLDKNGNMVNFIMNDKCAAGTGRFLDVMARTLALDVSELEKESDKTKNAATISSTCTVYAESEVISKLASGVPRPEVVLGICRSVVVRVAGMAKRLGIIPDVAMSGGVALNGAIRREMAATLGVPVLFNENAQYFGALGAALYAYRKSLE